MLRALLSIMIRRVRARAASVLRFSRHAAFASRYATPAAAYARSTYQYIREQIIARLFSPLCRRHGYASLPCHARVIVAIMPRLMLMACRDYAIIFMLLDAVI